MLTKQKVLQTVNSFPEEISVEDLIEKLVLLQKIENGIAQSEQGKTVSTAQAKERLNKWLK